MPRKLSHAASWPTLTQERLVTWGRTIRAQRLRQRITAADLCARLGISRATLRRLEQGDPGAAAGAYLTALLALGLAEQATPTLPAGLWQGGHGERVKPGRHEKGGDDDDYF